MIQEIRQKRDAICNICSISLNSKSLMRKHTLTQTLTLIQTQKHAPARTHTHKKQALIHKHLHTTQTLSDLPYKRISKKKNSCICFRRKVIYSKREANEDKSI